LIFQMYESILYMQNVITYLTRCELTRYPHVFVLPRFHNGSMKNAGIGIFKILVLLTYLLNY